jgi:hypothetical protein
MEILPAYDKDADTYGKHAETATRTAGLDGVAVRPSDPLPVAAVRQSGCRAESPGSERGTSGGRLLRASGGRLPRRAFGRLPPCADVPAIRGEAVAAPSIRKEVDIPGMIGYSSGITNQGGSRWTPQPPTMSTACDCFSRS